MTCLTRFSCALAFCLSASIPSWGQSAPVVYVATGDSNVYAVSTNGAANTALISNDSAYSGDTFTSLTVGPDNTSANTSGNNYFFLFACDSTNSQILRLKLSTNPFDGNGSLVTAADVQTLFAGGSGLTAPACGRVDANGDLYVSSKVSGSGVYVFNGVSTATGGFPLKPTQVYNIGGSFTGGGITQKNIGDMLIVDTAENSIQRATFVGGTFVAGTSPFSSTLSFFIQKKQKLLDTPVGIARAEAPEAGNANTIIGDLFVVNQGSFDNVLKFDPTSVSSPTTCATYGGGNQVPTSIAASEDNFLYVGLTNSNPNSGNKNNWQINVLNASTCKSAGTISYPAVPAGPLAVAVPPVGESPLLSPSFFDPSSGVSLTNYNFGSSLLQIAPGNCSISNVGQTQMPLQYLQALTSGIPTTTSWYGGTPVTGNGEGGFGTAYTFEVASACTPADVQTNLLIGGFYDPSKLSNPRIIHCEDDFTGCEVLETAGNWPTGGYLPNDNTVGGHVPGFGSKYFLVNGTLAASNISNSEPGTFCGFESPLIATTDLTQAPIITGNNISVKFKLVSGSESNCSSTSNITDAMALLSVARVSSQVGANATLDPATFQHITIVTQGSSTDSPPTFKFNPNSSNYQFSLNLKGYQKGTYVLSITFLTNNTANQYTYFAVK
jgi:hypothetical protein